MPLVEQRQMTHAEWLAEAIRRFGTSPLDYAFVCPNCGDVAAVKDFPPALRGRAGQECLGRVMADAAGVPYDEWKGRGCSFVAYGLIPGPWTVTMEDGKVIRSFAMAPGDPQ